MGVTYNPTDNFKGPIECRSLVLENHAMNFFDSLITPI